MEGKLYSADYRYIQTVAAGSDLHFLAGACPLDAAGVVRHKNDYAGQAALCLENARTVLEGHGMTLDEICFLRVLVASAAQADLAAAWDRLHGLMPDMPPATLQGVTVLGYTDQLVELEVVASTNRHG